MLSKEEKTKIVESLQIHRKDTGSTSVQIGVLTSQIKLLTEHCNQHKKRLQYPAWVG